MSADRAIGRLGPKLRYQQQYTFFDRDEVKASAGGGMLQQHEGLDRGPP